MAKGGIPLDEWSGSKATKVLHETVKKVEEVISAYSDGCWA